MSKKLYSADLVSGGEGCILLLSVVPNIVKIYNKTALFKFPFHGVNLNCKEKNWMEFIDAKGYRRAAEEVTDYVMHKGHDYFWKQAGIMEKISWGFEKSVRQLVKEISCMSDSQLETSYKQFVNLYMHSYAPGVITFLYELFLPEILIESTQDKRSDFSSVIESLNNIKYKSFMIESEEMLKGIRNSKPSQRNRLVAEYKDKFFYIKSNYEFGKVLDDADIAHLLQEVHGSKKIRKQVNFRLNKKEKAIIELMEPTLIIRDLRKKINLIGDYGLSRFMEQVSLRSKVKLDVIRNCYWDELFKILRSRKLIVKLYNRKESSLIFDHGKVIFSDRIIIKDRIRKTCSLKGTTASLGKARGRVRIINGPSEFSHFGTDEILVTFATRPEFLPIMKKAKAILTQEGGLTSHAAIVARELGKPCIVGIEGLVESVKNGDLVEVDADRGRVRKLK